MDDHRFDDLARAIADLSSRRRFLGGVGTALLAVFGVTSVGSAATLRGPGKTCRIDGNCIAGTHCGADARGHRICVCDTGTKACGNTCIPTSSCCKDTECRALNSACANGVCVAGQCQAHARKNGTTCPDGVCCDSACVACCNGVGKCIPCTTASTCPGQDTACKTRTCVSGFCGISQTQAGTAIASQTAGDCKKQVCNAAGTVVFVNDNTDLPTDDGNQCTSEVCANGTPAHPPRTVRTSCNQNGGTLCDGSGRCVACLAASDCPGQDTECQHRVCDSGACGFARTASGTALAHQTVGDCKRVECDGLGGTIEVADDSDLPDDDNPCTRNVCTAGLPSHPFVTIGTSCGTGLICDGAGACVGCTTPSDCPGQDNSCQTRTCTAGACGLSYAASGTGCGENGGTYCNGSGSCVGCLTASTCPGEDSDCQTRTCVNGVCGFSYAPSDTEIAAQTLGDCKQEVCNGAGSVVLIDDDGDLPPDDGNPCTSNACSNGVPSHPPVGGATSCNQNGGTVCSGGVCVKLSGQPCSASTECLSDFCAQGVCCDAACTGTCVACTAAMKGSGSDGVCGVIQAGFDPKNECSGSRTCNGSGSCTGCQSAADCPGEDTECQTRTCTAGDCGFTFAATGTVIAAQIRGDCKSAQCDGNGNVIQVVDDGDLPSDGNPCTLDLCTNGVASHPFATPGTTCGDGLTCNENGTCGTCSSASDCPGTDTDCRTRTCINGGCGFSNAAAGTNCDDGDGEVCDGAGNCVAKSSEGQGCSSAADCPGEDSECRQRTCVAGQCGASFMPTGTECSQSGGVICNGSGTCVPQKLRGQPCSFDGECTSGFCADAVCCDASCHLPCRACTAALKGTGEDGVCGMIKAGTDPDDECPGSTTCDGNGACTACTSAADCPGQDDECRQRTCVNGVCGISFTASGTSTAAQTNGDCKKHVCNGEGQIVEANDDTDTPTESATSCTAGVCSNGVATYVSVAAGTACGEDGGSICDGSGNCVGCLVPSQCPGQDTECQTRTCTAGVCGFNVVAAGTALAVQTIGDCRRAECDGAGGVSYVADDDDLPASDDGNQCTENTCSAGVPYPPLPLGTECTQFGGAICDGQGTCIKQSFNGSPCSVPVQCLSFNCVNGVCVS